jgi:CHASE2 domain-containing sensor protein
MLRLSPRKALSTFLLFIFAILLFCGSYFRAFDNNELDTLDLRFRLRPPIPTSDRIVIIEIGEDTLEKLGRFPFDRGYHALIVDALFEYGAKAIMFDIFFSEPDKSDASFEQAIKAAGNVYLPYVLEISNRSGQGIPQASGYSALNIASLSKAAKGTGHINVTPDFDGKFRSVPLLVEYRGLLSRYLSFLLACDYLGCSQKDIKFVPSRFIQCGPEIKIPLDENSNFLVNYAGEWGRFYRHYSYADVLGSYSALRSGGKPVLDLNIFRDKICLIGLTAAGITDLHPNPFSSLYPALGIHADIISSILQRRFIARVPKAANLAVLLVLLTLVVWAVSRARPLKGFLALLFVVALYAGICVLLFAVWGFWLDMFYPVFALGIVYLARLFGLYVRELKNRLLMENELKIAKEIQESFLPKSLPSIKGIEAAAAMYTAREVGGDLYDFYEISPEKLAVLIGDVTGKGIPASLFMSKVSGAFKFLAAQDKHPAETLSDLNMKLTREAATPTFVTIFYCLFDTNKRVMKFASAGHPPVLYLAKNSSSKFLDTEEGSPLGMMEGAYARNQISYSRGDIFIFYTDGVTEARDRHGKMYGPDRLVSVAQRYRESSCQDILNAIKEDARRFEPKSRQHDDLTLIVIKAT